MEKKLFDRIALALEPSAPPHAALAVPSGESPTAVGRGPALRVTGEGALPSRFDVTGLAVASIAAAGSEIARLSAAQIARSTGRTPTDWPAIEVDRRLASFWFGFSIRPEGWTMASPWDPIAGDYATRDGWIRLHTNAPHHRAAALRVLGVAAEKSAIADAVRGLEGDALETAIVEAGGCAARMRSIEAWHAHPQGQAVRSEPLIAWQTRGLGMGSKAGSNENGANEQCAGSIGWTSRAEARQPWPAPLAGIRVLDLTRVLAGPVSTRFLAAFGADVLRIDPPDWDEPGVIPEVTLGKRCAGLDLRRAEDRERFGELLAGADVLVHGYRPGALAGLGWDDAAIRERNPALVDVALCAYGGRGPWQGRRGFDSLVQMSSGIAEAGRLWARADRPTPLPVQALDQATGYLMAAAAVRGLRLRQEEGLASTARLSLARTAELLIEAGDAPTAAPLAAETGADLETELEATDWGPARRIRFPLRVEGVSMGAGGPARTLRSDSARWRAGT